MGIIEAKLELRNPRKPEIRPVETPALADTGAYLLVIPEHVAIQLELETLDEREITVADGRHIKVPYAGPIELKFENRKGYFGALVMGDQVLLGAVPMEDLDLVLSPKERKITVNPQSPNVASGIVK